MTFPPGSEAARLPGFRPAHLSRGRARCPPPRVDGRIARTALPAHRPDVPSWLQSERGAPDKCPGAPREEPRTLSESRARQSVRYLRTADGVRLAWAEVGRGPSLVKAANWLTHLELEWQSPIWRHWVH